MHQRFHLETGNAHGRDMVPSGLGQEAWSLHEPFCVFGAREHLPQAWLSAWTLGSLALVVVHEKLTGSCVFVFWGTSYLWFMGIIFLIAWRVVVESVSAGTVIIFINIEVTVLHTEGEREVEGKLWSG